MLQITPISAFADNYIWACCLPDSQFCLVVDPGDASVVQHFLQQNGKTLGAILITHHHNDHIGGLAALRQAYPTARVIGPAAEAWRISGLTEQVNHGDAVFIPELNLQFTVMAVPGHTLGHIAFYAAPALFCGDTLFSVGCGRLFEGSPLQMWQSLQQLMSLPDNTLIYCSHEYTQANIRFALTIEPDNQALIDYAEKCTLLRKTGQATLPAVLATEKAVNPFLRSDNSKLQQQLQQNSALALFTTLRLAKDSFNG